MVENVILLAIFVMFVFSLFCGWLGLKVVGVLWMVCKVCKENEKDSFVTICEDCINKELAKDKEELEWE